jgi:hypothetical protein
MFVFNKFPAFHYRTIAFKARNVAFKSRIKFRLKFVQDLTAKFDLIPFLCNRFIPAFEYKHPGKFRGLSAAKQLIRTYSGI